jgi:Rrf2 family transcriptional regulator, nitric oxide-sensitive transcriptional repressor
MKLLTSTDFALRVLIRLASTPETHISTDTLAQELVVSRHHLHKIVQFLTKVGFVRTIRGARGGVMLARPASQINLGAVIRRHEKDQALVECFRPDGGACNLLPRCRLRGILKAAKEGFYGHLDRYTLADCFTEPRAPARRRQIRIRQRRRAFALQ